LKNKIEIIAEGKGELLGWRDPDENRVWVRENKPRGLVDKQMSVKEAVEKFVQDGDFLAIGGFGHPGPDGCCL
jgi:predicted urease superfamily metal-dependent hydrolase